MCNQALFECLALNLHCLRGDQSALTAVINHRIVSTALSLAARQTPDDPDMFTGYRASSLSFSVNDYEPNEAVTVLTVCFSR